MVTESKNNFLEIFDELMKSLKEIGTASDQASKDRAQRHSEASIDSLESWREARPPYLPSCGKTRSEYLNQLWHLTKKLRRRGKYFEALITRRLLLETCDQSNPEVIPLATAVATAFGSDSRFSRSPQWEWAFAIVFEAANMCISPLPEASLNAFRRMLDSVRIDWGNPVSYQQSPERRITAKEQIDFNLERIERLLSMNKSSATNLGEQLLFWKAMGHWRNGSPPYYEACEEFDNLIDRTSANFVYRWCRARIAFEAANGDGLAYVEQEIQKWKTLGIHLDQRVEPAHVARYFELLRYAESLLGRRAEKFESPSNVEAVVRLANQLNSLTRSIVGSHAIVSQHLQPIVDSIYQQAKKLTASKPSPSDRPVSAEELTAAPPISNPPPLSTRGHAVRPPPLPTKSNNREK